MTAGLDALMLGAAALAGKVIPKGLAAAEELTEGARSAAAGAAATKAVERNNVSSGASAGSVTARGFTAPSGEMVALPANASMSNLEVRQWYLDQEALIPKLIDKTTSLEQQAKQAWELRNTFRSAARSAMTDQVPK